MLSGACEGLWLFGTIESGCLLVVELDKQDSVGAGARLGPDQHARQGIRRHGPQ